MDSKDSDMDSKRWASITKNVSYKMDHIDKKTIKVSISEIL